ncbi:conserved hypothetical protein (plasmid) [Candidatus Protochlamydia naegleriophila]|uniref:Uncharacterized protein n=1 Tax=Candidatus Protochlamydia naegleriophila TaxID=389348 RepID=A0A0U5JGE4_9BACT|nr:hypothetical protein [Candidatus Protochlamydia naegleriophila]CUI18173.1 conserved hypothetical protein [Candidatus Protochlamydia naegleriophila]
MLSSTVGSYGRTQVVVPEDELNELKTKMKGTLRSYLIHKKELETNLQKLSLHTQQKEQAEAELKLAKERALASQEKAKISKANLDTKTSVLITGLFAATFGKKIDPSKASEMVSQYCLDEAFTIEIEKKACHVISTSPFVQYLKANSDVKTCDFRRFATITDVKTLADYLQSSSSSVTSVIIKQSISANDKDILDKAASIKKTMKVQYA